MKKTKKRKISQDKKKALATLREKGVYNPKNSRKVTKYGLSLINKFSDVLSGQTKVVKVDKQTARKYADNKGNSGQVRVKGDKILVPVQKGEKVSVSRKKHEISVYRELDTGQRYVRTPFVKKLNANRVYSDYSTLRDQLGPNDYIAVSIYRGKNRPREWQRYTADEFYNAFIGGYADANTTQQKMKALAWALESAQISRYVEKSK